ncbi:LPS assembly protein LptD [Thiohalobacter sp. IOR34]|uniref:LPS-assembly protein LptD n=1 Tax=Thiohalobacter sp. IOR34 TaxID=3057176 RepID=UPI0025B1B021|nr:LPS assembly protein LptD [Thiohalobacter sp. IOR34]WJW75908.1 LPS assembly protein LptD [Thiohalobacter sp. IOR34]
MTTSRSLPLWLALVALPALAADPAPAWQCQTDATGRWRCLPAGETPAAAPAARTAAPAAAAATTPARTPPAGTQAAARPLVQASPTVATPSLPSQRQLLCRRRPGLSAPLPGPEQVETRLDARQARIEQGTRYLLSGDARIERSGQRLRADRLRYDEAAGTADAEGHVLLEEPGLRIEGSRAHLLLDEDRGEIEDVRYDLFSRYARGSARIAYQDSRTRKRFEQATYTTCDEGAEAWRLKAREVKLDEAKGVGRARHVILELAEIPVFYTPFMSFPLDDRRKSGFLVPSWGRSDESGADVRLPYYWNIAPNRDATITPRLLSDRGVQLRGEYRYLQRHGEGRLDLEYLPSDKAFGNQTRSLFSLRHSGRPTRQIGIKLDFKNVSDAEYFEDLGDNLGLSATTHIRRVGELSYSARGWNLTGRLEDFQTVDRTIAASNRPYKRLPQILFRGQPASRPYGLELRLDAEAVRFDKDAAVTGTRFDLRPEAALPLGDAAWYLTPRLALRHTRYSLQNTAPGDPDSPSRTLPIASLDGGLFLERDSRWFGHSLLQTLEPRAFYLFVPKRDQLDLPLFDTGLRDFSYQQLFASNRFSGADRQGDANQLTLALSSRLLDPASGRQLLRLSLGEIFYFRDREVILRSGDPVEQRSNSKLVALLDLALQGGWTLSSGLQWDPRSTRNERGSLRLRYQPDARHSLNLTYRYRRDRLEQVDASAFWHLTPRWHLVARWNYSLPDRLLLTGLGGLEYESCCWVFRILGRSYINDTQGRRNNSLLLQLELKGLTSFGDPISELLQNDILGYRTYP